MRRRPPVKPIFRPACRVRLTDHRGHPAGHMLSSRSDDSPRFEGEIFMEEKGNEDDGDDHESSGKIRAHSYSIQYPYSARI
jgi:hypothetical protein